MRIDAAKPTTPPDRASVQKMADGLERAFLSEMLKDAGPRSAEGGFAGGVGESQFSSMLTDAYADALSAKLDLGLIKNTGSES